MHRLLGLVAIIGLGFIGAASCDRSSDGPAAQCSNGIKDENEGGVDCGGSSVYSAECPKCGNWASCGGNNPSYCESFNCEPYLYNDGREDRLDFVCMPEGCEQVQSDNDYFIECDGVRVDDPLDPDGGDCSEEESGLAGSWITPEDAPVDPNGSYARLTLNIGGGGEVEQYAGGANQNTSITAWKVEGASCDELHLDYGSGYGSDYSEIQEFSDSTLQLQATDGSFYGATTRYRREGGANEPTTCDASCATSNDCDSGQACLDTNDGMLCLPVECGTCFGQDDGCSYDRSSCQWTECVTPSTTCGNSCDMGEPCDPGEQCIDTGAGFNCLPPECGDCIESGLLCDYSGQFCDFTECL